MYDVFIGLKKLFTIFVVCFLFVILIGPVFCELCVYIFLPFGESNGKTLLTVLLGSGVFKYASIVHL